MTRTLFALCFIAGGLLILFQAKHLESQAKNIESQVDVLSKAFDERDAQIHRYQAAFNPTDDCSRLGGVTHNHVCLIPGSAEYSNYCREKGGAVGPSAGRVFCMMGDTSPVFPGLGMDEEEVLTWTCKVYRANCEALVQMKKKP